MAITSRAQIRAKKKNPLAVDPLEVVVLDEPEKFKNVDTLLSSEEMGQIQGVLLKT